MTEKEAEMRIFDYRSQGYEVVWLLDDKRYNKRALRPAESYLRQRCTYYLCIRPGLTSAIYDQFEVFAEGKRVRRGKRMLIDLQKIRPLPKKIFDKTIFPKQITELCVTKYFDGDRMHRALQFHMSAMQRWRLLELELAKPLKQKNKFKEWLYRTILRPYQNFIANLVTKRYSGRS